MTTATFQNLRKKEDHIQELLTQKLVLYKLEGKAYLPVIYRKVLFPQPHETQKLKNPDSWIFLEHDSAGIFSNKRYLEVMPLPLKPRLEPLLEDLHLGYFGSSLYAPCPLKEANRYQALLRKYRLSTNMDHHLLEEGFYPIDIQYLSRTTTLQFPKDLTNLLEKSQEEITYFPTQFHLAILGPSHL